MGSTGTLRVHEENTGWCGGLIYTVDGRKKLEMRAKPLYLPPIV